MAWSVVSGADQRAKAIRRLAIRYFNDRVAESERVHVEKALTLYLEDTSVKVRRSLARAVARYDHAPRHLVWALSRDISEVATLIYARSSGLHGRDLMDAIRRGDENIQMAIAGRANLDGSTTRELIAHGCSAAILVLLKNEQVVLSPGLKHDIAERLGSNSDVRGLLLEDDMIEAATRQVLTNKLTGSLLDFARSMGCEDSKRIDDIALDARNRVTVEIAMQTAPDAMGGYVDHLAHTDQLSPALLIRASCMGHAALFEAALAKLSGASLKRVQSIIDDGRISSFSSLYGKTGLPQSAYPVFVAAIKAWQEPLEMPEMIERIISAAERAPEVDGELLSMLSQMACEANREAAQDYEKQLLLAA